MSTSPLPQNATSEAKLTFLQGNAAGRGGPLFVNHGTVKEVVDRSFARADMSYQSIVENALDAIIVADAESRIISWNNGARTMFGYERVEALGKPLQMLMPERFRQHHSEGFKRLLSTGQGHLLGRMVEIVAQKKSGEEFPVELSLSMHSTSDGTTFNAIIRDISERKGLQGALAESERRYREMISDAVQGVFRSTRDGRLLFANKSLLDMLGYSSFEELAAVDLTDLYIDPTQRTALSLMLAQKGSCASVEFDLKRKDGTVITVLEHSRVIKDDLGTSIVFEGMIEDISERKRNEVALERKRIQLRTLVDNLPDLIYFKDNEGRYLLNNLPHLRSIAVASQEEVVGKSSYDFHPPEMAALYHDDEMKIIQTGTPLVDKEERAFHKGDGQVRWHLTSKFPVINSQGEVTGLVGISRDITQRKEMEDRLRENMIALQASREQLAHLNTQKDRMMSILSHDLRSPFSSILGFCEILLSEGENLSDAERTEFVTHIQRSAEQQLALLNKLLDWSRFETGRIKLELKDIDLALIARASVETHLGLAMKKGITLRSSLPNGMLAHVDETMIGQVLNNLLSNALKFTPAGGLISVEPMDSAGEMWVIAVRDTGAGIPEGDMKKLFKIEEKYTRKGLQGESGTGLGLSVVAEIVKKHSGSISVESEVDKGTAFIIRIPKNVSGNGQALLVVDDDPGIRALHARYLKRMFPQRDVIQACDGHEALQLARKYKPRIVITDYSMPGMNGFEFLTSLKEDLSTRSIPVLVVTGKDSEDGRESLLLSGASEVLTKPIAVTKLQESIERILSEKG